MFETYYFRDNIRLFSFDKIRTNNRFDHPRFLTEKSLTRVLTPDTFRIQGRTRQKLNKAKRQGFTLCEELTDEVLSLFDGNIAGGHAPPKWRIKANTVKHNIHWRCCCLKGEILSAIGYVQTENRARFIYIARNKDFSDQSKVSEASIFLFEDLIQHLFSSLIENIDLGGVSTSFKTSENGIDRFKRHFGGDVMEFYTYYGLVAWLVMALRRAKITKQVYE